MDPATFIAAQLAQATSKADLRQKIADVVNVLNAYLMELDTQLAQAPVQFAAITPGYNAFVEQLPNPDIAPIIDTLTDHGTYPSPPAP